MIDKYKLSDLVLGACNEYEMRIDELTSQLEDARQQAKAWAIRAGVAEQNTDTAIKAALDDIEGR
jgi:hypothetical protein